MTDSMKIDQGGPAFPEIGNIGHNSDWQNESGMSLRDWFAGKALAGFAANNAVFAANNQNGWDLVNASARDVADRAYWLADAMIAARKGGAA